MVGFLLSTLRSNCSKTSCYLHVCAFLSCPERLHRWAHPQYVPHKPGGPSNGHGVHAVRVHRTRPGNNLNCRICVSQSEGKEEEKLAGLLVSLNCMLQSWHVAPLTSIK